MALSDEFLHVELFLDNHHTLSVFPRNLRLCRGITGLNMLWFDEGQDYCSTGRS